MFRNKTRSKKGYGKSPDQVRHDANLSLGAKLIYIDIHSLCRQKGYCYASNLYFADLYDKDERTISRWIGELKRAKYIKTTIEHMTDRKIFILALSHEQTNDLSNAA